MHWAGCVYGGTRNFDLILRHSPAADDSAELPAAPDVSEQVDACPRDVAAATQVLRARDLHVVSS